jgi:hypothetical protein
MTQERAATSEQAMAPPAESSHGSGQHGAERADFGGVERRDERSSRKSLDGRCER